MRTVYRSVPLLLICLLALIQCQSPSSGSSGADDIGTTKADSLPGWMKDAVIYEVNVRQYTPEGTFAAFRRHLPRLKEMGVKTLWFMPVYPVSQVKRKGSLGSYYAVGNTREVNPAFGSMEEFRQLVREIHSMGMYVILDWVPNHTGWDHPWIAEHPEYYTHDPVTDTIVHPANTDWYDVADLNYDQPGLTEAMIGEMAYWVKEVGIDGFRCDMAGMVPVSFWEEATPALLSLKSDLFLLAETMDPPLRNEQLFHADYGWAFKDLANGICQGQKTIADLNTYLNEDSVTYRSGAHLYFTSNHDENSWHGTEFERLGKGAEAMYILAATLPGIPLIYSGQEEPLQKRLLFFEKDDIGFKTFGYAGFYQRLNQLKQVNSAVYSPPYGGVLTILSPSNPSTFAYTRENGDDRLLVVVNLSDQAQETRIDIGDWNGTYRDIFRGTQQALANPMTLQIGPWGYMVLSNR